MENKNEVTHNRRYVIRDLHTKLQKEIYAESEISAFQEFQKLNPYFWEGIKFSLRRCHNSVIFESKRFHHWIFFRFRVYALRFGEFI